eukprot:gb/GEZN01004095.1/.p1 GENE.gb/GEZN01004095.1/~~gb/GEZN01004095.1/.p1  ORF type:complete len:530 (-),score=74.01 gb/GEZN01004095.1/:346-1935(-)
MSKGPPILPRQSSVARLWDVNTAQSPARSPGASLFTPAPFTMDGEPAAKPDEKKALPVAADIKSAAAKTGPRGEAVHVPGQFATLTLPNGETVQLKVLEKAGFAEEAYALDIRGLFPKVMFFDPGFSSTAACASAITFIDGPNGILRYRGYSIEDLCEHSDYEEVTYLLLYGQLPSARQKAIHHHALTTERMVHLTLRKFFDGFESTAHPMAMMVGVVGALSSFYHDSLDISNAEHRASCAYRLIAQMPTIAAVAFRLSRGEPTIWPRTDLSYAENFLHMMFASPAEPNFKVNPVMVEAMETFLILHADHEQNASTSTVRIAGSSLANPFACIASGVSALWGPSHGGANEAVLKMLEEMGSKDRIPEFLAKAKDKNDSFRLMGFGHRVYKNYDPRARMMQKVCHKVLAATGLKKEPLLELAVELEKLALKDPYFVKRKLFPNVDFYSGICLRAMGIPNSMFTVLFAVARVSGWISQWKEMIEENQRIARPRQLYLGSGSRNFVPVSARPETISKEEFEDQTRPRTKVGC